MTPEQMRRMPTVVQILVPFPYTTGTIAMLLAVIAAFTKGPVVTRVTGVLHRINAVLSDAL